MYKMKSHTRTENLLSKPYKRLKQATQPNPIQSMNG